MLAHLKSLTFPFCICLLSTLIIPLYLPSFRLLPFAPLITIIVSRFRLPNALWLAAILGLMVDLLSFSTPLGLFSLNYCLSTLLIYRYRKYFLEEKVFIFALYSILFSFVCSSILFLLFALIEIRLKLTLPILFSDFILMPILDGIYAGLFVLFPMYAYQLIVEPKRIMQLKITFLKWRKKALLRWNQLRANT